jgi:hypothetical protein
MIFQHTKPRRGRHFGKPDRPEMTKDSCTPALTSDRAACPERAACLLGSRHVPRPRLHVPGLHVHDARIFQAATAAGSGPRHNSTNCARRRTAWILS